MKKALPRVLFIFVGLFFYVLLMLLFPEKEVRPVRPRHLGDKSQEVEKKERIQQKKIASDNKLRQEKQREKEEKLRKEKTEKARKRKQKPVENIKKLDFKESDLYKKENMGNFLTIALAVDLNEENISYTDISIEVVNKKASVSSIVVEVSPRDRDITLDKHTNIRIVSLACQEVGHVTMKSNWESKYLNIVIKKSDTLDRLNFLFLTKECRKYVQLLKNQKGKATLHWMKIFIDSLVRGKENIDWMS